MAERIGSVLARFEAPLRSSPFLPPNKIDLLYSNCFTYIYICLYVCSCIYVYMSVAIYLSIYLSIYVSSSCFRLIYPKI